MPAIIGGDKLGEVRLTRSIKSIELRKQLTFGAASELADYFVYLRDQEESGVTIKCVTRRQDDSYEVSVDVEHASPAHPCCNGCVGLSLTVVTWNNIPRHTYPAKGGYGSCIRHTRGESDNGDLGSHVPAPVVVAAARIQSHLLAGKGCPSAVFASFETYEGNVAVSIVSGHCAKRQSHTFYRDIHCITARDYMGCRQYLVVADTDT